MGILSRIFARPFTRKNDPERSNRISVSLRQAGELVTHDTAFKFSAFYRGVSYISETIGCLPWEVIKESDSTTKKLTNHPAWNLIKKRPNPEMSAKTWRQTMIAWAISWGNGFSEIERNFAGQPVALWPISPDRVTVCRDTETSDIYYEVSNYSGGTTIIQPENMFHLRGLGFDGLTGYSVITMAARSIGLALAMEGYGADFFANGAVTTGALKHPKRLGEGVADRIRSSFDEVIRGRGKRFRVPIFEENMDWIDLMIKPEDAQLLISREFQITEMARWLGLPPHKLGDLTRATFSNIEEQNIEVVTDALLPRIVDLEQEADYKLIRSNERGVRTKINVRGLLRGDNKNRAEYYKIMREIAAYSTNDIRRLEDVDPVGPEGDELIIQLSYTTLKRLVSGVDEKQADEPDIAPEIQRQAFYQLFQSAQDRLLRREIGQFERDKGKIKDFKGLNAWFENFYPNHQRIMKQVLGELAYSFAAVTGSTANGQVRECIDEYVQAHVGQSKQYFLTAFDGQANEVWPETRQVEGAKQLTSRLLALSSENMQ